MVAASPSGVAAALSLGTDSIPFNTSGPFLDRIGSELYLHSGVRRLFSTKAGTNVLPQGGDRPSLGVTGRRGRCPRCGPLVASGRGHGTWRGPSGQASKGLALTVGI